MLRHKLPGGKTIELAADDITLQRVDAIVNAANGSILGGGGVDGVIHRAGGPEILAECRALRASTLPDGLPTGQAVLTTAGRMAARAVIHTVGPVYQDGHHGEPEALASCHRETLRLADAHGFATIAFPAISTGAYGYPTEEAAKVAVGVVADELPGCRSVATVRFVLFGKGPLHSFAEAAARRLGPPS